MNAGGPSGGTFRELALATIDDDPVAVKSLLAAGADVNARDPDWASTPLIFAALLGRAEIARMLIAAGADIHATDNYGTDALTLAEIDWQVTQQIAQMQRIPLTNPEAIKEGKAAIAEMLRAGVSA